MASIILSFVGQQDPVSDLTREEGSIVSLIRHLVTEQQSIKQVILLYTAGTQEQAELTQGWLMDAPFHLAQSMITLMPVEEGLSADPVDVWLAVQSARQGLEVAIAHCTAQDWLELNGSSGTPVMKSAWSILQAAGYAPRSRVWQVRNPKEQQANQARVFQSNMQVLRREFDVRVMKQQLKDYNYAGARTTLKASSLGTTVIEALLAYGHCRLSLDFKGAVEAIAPVQRIVDRRWQLEGEMLWQRNSLALLREVYFNAVLELKNQKYADFLVRVSQFQEKALHHLVNQYLAEQPRLPQSFNETISFWEALAAHHPDLYQFLETSCYRNTPLRLEAFPGRPVLLAIVEYSKHPVIEFLQTLNADYEQRNRIIHNFEGISELEGADRILKTMREILSHMGEQSFNNPFNELNAAISQLLEAELQFTEKSEMSL